MKKLFTVLAAIVCLLLVFAVQAPYRSVITTATLSSVQSDNYPQELSSAIAEHLFRPLAAPTFADTVYIIRDEYLIKKDRITYVIPYITANIDDVGIAGTSDWIFLLDTLVLEEDGTLDTNAKYNQSSSTFIVEANPNTVITEFFYGDLNGDNIVSIILDKNKWSIMDEHVFSIHASTSDSNEPRNVNSMASFRWESALSYHIGKAVPFAVEGNVPYINNYKG